MSVLMNKKTEKNKDKKTAYEQVEYPEKKANKVASVTSGQRSPTKMLKCPARMKIIIID
jgi:hypothetical protein